MYSKCLSMKLCSNGKLRPWPNPGVKPATIRHHCKLDTYKVTKEFKNNLALIVVPYQPLWAGKAQQMDVSNSSLRYEIY